jgi:hypothetical protein
MFGTKIRLPKELLESCKQHAANAGYASVEEFVAHTLEKEIRRAPSNSLQEGNEALTERLKGLGYLE